MPEAAGKRVRSIDGSLRSAVERLLSAGLSMFVCFHLASMFLTPNWQNYLGDRASTVLTPYVNFFELTGNWSFFAPDIGPPPIFLEWEIFDKKRKLIEHDRWPPPPEAFFLRERQNRRISAVRFMLAAENRAGRMMTPYLCRKNPNATSVRLSKVLYRLPPFAWGKRSGGSQVEPNPAIVSPFDLAPGNGFVKTIVSDEYCDVGVSS